VTFDNPPINLIDPVMAVELDALLTEIELDDGQRSNADSEVR
jgi:hypothetical protein